VCASPEFLATYNSFNAFMKTLASRVDIGENGIGRSIYELDTPIQTFVIGERVVDNRVVNLFIAGLTLHMFLQNPSLAMHISQIRMSDLKTYRRLLPNSEDVTTAYFEQRTGVTGLRSLTPDNDELIVLATYFFAPHRSGSVSNALNALTNTRIIIDHTGERERGGGAKKRNKSKRRKQKTSNKQSRHHNRKRFSRRKRFY
jgi:hypothetical protein